VGRTFWSVWWEGHPVWYVHIVGTGGSVEEGEKGGQRKYGLVVREMQLLHMAWTCLCARVIVRQEGNLEMNGSSYGVTIRGHCLVRSSS
jgi:hypothetical protein